MNRNLIHNLGVQPLCHSQAIPSNANIPSAVTDTLGFDSAMLVVDIGEKGVDLSDAVFLKIRFEHSDDGLNFIPIAKSTLQTSHTLDDQASLLINANNKARRFYKLSYLGHKRYLRLTTQSSDHHDQPTCLSAWVILGHPSLQPVLES